MEKIVLKVKKRSETGKAARRAANGRIPAVLYGNNVSTQNIWVDALALERTFAVAGTNTIVSLAVESGSPVNVLIYDYQTDPIANHFAHVDFYAVNMKEEVEARIPVEFTGVAVAVKELGGTLVKTLDELSVRALPSDLPREIIVDLSALKTFEDRITVGDLQISDKIEILVEPDTVVAMVDEPRTEEELAALDDAVDADVSKVEGVADKEPADTDDDASTEKK